MRILVLALVLAWSPAPQTPSSRLAGTVVPASPPLVLDSSAPESAAADLIARLLRATGVPFGLETSPPSGPMEIGPLVRAPERGALNGLRLGEALDAIVRLTPRFRWREVNGTIVVRTTTDSTGFLDRRIPHFVVTNASPMEALTALRAAMAPGATTAGPGRSGGEGASAMGNAINVSLDNATVEEILAAIARAGGSASSWAVRYTAFPAVPVNASIVLTIDGHDVVSPSPAAMAGAPNAPPADRVRMSAANLGYLLESYAQSVHIQIGAEILDASGPGRGPGTMLTVDAPRVPADGIAEILKLDPRYELSNDNGIFHVTPKPGTPGRLAVLDRKTAGLSVINEPVGVVFDRVLWLVGVQPGGGGGHVRDDSPLMKPVSFGVAPGATVRDLLDALCRAQGAMSWNVQPRNGGADFTIRTNEDGAIRYLLDAPASPLPLRSEPFATGDVHVGGSDVGQLLSSYAHRADVQLGVELAALNAPPSARQLYTLAVPSDPAAGVAEIIKIDPRYVTSTNDRIVHVALPPGTPYRIPLLDKIVHGFSASDEPMGLVFDRIIWLLGMQPGMGGRPLEADSPFNRRISLSVTRDVTVRDLLDMLVGAEGTASWELRQTAFNNGQLILSLTARPPFRLSRSLGLQVTDLGLPPAAATKAPAVRVPVTLDRPIKQFQVFIGGDIDTSFMTLAGKAHAPMGIEMLPRAPFGTGNARVVRTGAPPPPLLLGPGPLSDALYVLLEHEPEYELRVADDVLDIVPTKFLGAAGDFLDVLLDRFSVNNITVGEAIHVLRHQLNPAFPERQMGMAGSIGGSSAADIQRRSQAADALFSRHVTLTMEHATPRQILNKLVSLHGELYWMTEYRAGIDTAPTEANCTISLGTFDDVGIRQSYGPASAPVATPPRPQPALVDPRTMIVPGARRILIALPTDGQSLHGALNRFARETRTPMGVEVIAPDGPLSPGSSRFDVAGLSTAAALDKILASMPDYEWRKDGDIYHVRPKAFAGNPAVALDKRLESFHQDLPSAFDALASIFAALDRPLPPRPPNAPTPPNLRGFVDKPMTINLTNVTLREVLDQIVRQGGDLLWLAQYSDASGPASSLALSLNGFDAGSINIHGR